MINVTIFHTGENVKQLKRLLLERDMTFAPMGSGGYAINKLRDRRNMLSITELDTAPAESYKVGVKKGMIWVGRISWFVKEILANSNIVFREEIREFQNPEEINLAFTKA